MPFRPQDRTLEPVARFLPRDAMVLFCKAANDAADSGGDHNAAMRAGWAEVSKTWEKPEQGKKWVRKDTPSASSVHVDTPLGTKPKKRPDEMTDAKKFQSDAQVCKVDDALGLVFGYAIVCLEKGEPYFDSQDDHIPEDAMLKAASDFMQNSRTAGDMHTDEDGVPVSVSGKPAAKAGNIVFAFPLTTDIAKALGITTEKTGLLIAMKPDDPAILAKYKSGEYSGFSIGGNRVTDEEVA